MLQSHPSLSCLTLSYSLNRMQIWRQGRGGPLTSSPRIQELAHWASNTFPQGCSDIGGVLSRRSHCEENPLYEAIFLQGDLGPQKSLRKDCLPSPAPQLFEVKAHQCDQCPYRTDIHHNLVRHMKKHTGERPFGCGYCPYRSISKQHITRHCFHKHPHLGPSVIKHSS